MGALAAGAAPGGTAATGTAGAAAAATGGGEVRHTRGQEECAPRVFTIAGLEEEKGRRSSSLRGRGEFQKLGKGKVK